MRRDELHVTAPEHFREISHRVRFQEIFQGFLMRGQRVVYIDFRVAQHDGKLRACHALFASLAVLDFYVVGEVLEVTIQQAASFETGNYPADLVYALQGPYFTHAERLRLQVVVAQNIVRHVVGHRGKQFIAFFTRYAFLLGDVAQQDLDVYLAVGTVDARGVVYEVGVDATAVQAEFDAAPLRQPEIAAFAYDLAAQLVCIYAHVIAAAIADIGVAFRAGLHIGADAAVPKQVGGHPEYCLYKFVGLHRRIFGVEHRPRFLAQADGLRLPGEHAAALGNDLVVVVRPAGAWQLEQALALLEAGGHIGIRVQEDVLMIESRDELDLPRKQHPVSEHVTAHVADADDRKRISLRVESLLAEMTLDGFPGAARRDAHFLVVVAGRAAGGECVVEPEIVALRDFVRDVRESRSALVGGDNEIRVVAIAP